MKNKINLGIIGKNFGYKVIYKSFLKNKKYKVKGFSFKSKNSNNIKIPKNTKIYSNWKNLILDKKIDAVAVATPPFLHDKIIKFAIKNNKHVFCEKPFTHSFKKANMICNLLNKKKNISHMVNYEFASIDAFQLFKKNIIKKILIKEINLNWLIRLNKKNRNSWKENHNKGGGIIFNYICHSIYYLEFLFGKINSIKTTIFFKKKNQVRCLKGKFYFTNGLSANLNIQVGALNNKTKPIHQIKIKSIK
jgi:predicted dehydrogenase